MGRSGSKSAVYIQKSKVDEPEEGLLSDAYYSKQYKQYKKNSTLYSQSLLNDECW